MENLAGILFLISLFGLLIGIINPKWVTFGKKRTRGRVLLIYGLVFIISPVLFGVFTSQTESTKKKAIAAKPSTITKQNPAQESVDQKKIFTSDPDYQDWLELDKKTTPFKKNRKWLKKNFEYMRILNRKWQIEKDDQIVSLINQMDSKFLPYSLSEEEFCQRSKGCFDHLKEEFKKRIIHCVVYKKTPELPITFEKFSTLAKYYGFKVYIEGEKWPNGFWGSEHKYYKEFEIKRGEKKGKGQCFSADINQQGNVVHINIPLGESQMKMNWWLNMPKDKNAQKARFMSCLNDIFSNSPDWVLPSFYLILGEKSQIVIDKLAEIGTANIKQIKKMSTNKKFDYNNWFSTLLVGNKEIFFGFVAGSASLTIFEATKLSEIYETLIKES